MNIFIIDNEIAFFPEERKLLCLKNMSEYTVHRASERCLTLLIECQGRVVTHNELMIVGWGDDALRTISTATYYQAFVNLRKTFKKLGYEKDVFITVRGKGIRFNSYIDIRKEKVLPSNSLLFPSDEIQKDIKSDQLFNSDENNYEKILEHKSICLHFTNKITKLNHHKIFLLLVLTLILSIIVFLINFNNDIKIPGFIQNKHSPVCFYFNDKNKNNEFAIDFLNKKGFTCEAQKSYYISYFQTSPRLTVFICDGNNSFYKCESETYIVYE